MSGGLIINSPLRHLGLKEHNDQDNEGKDKPRDRREHRSANKDERREAADSRRYVRKDRKICRGRFFIRRKNSHGDAKKREERPSRGRREDRQAGGRPHRAHDPVSRRSHQPRDQQPKAVRGVPYHLRNRHSADDSVNDSAQVN